MPCFNAEKYLSQAIESILTQTYSDFEFIIIYDNSTDNSIKLLSEYAKRDARIKVIINSTVLGLCNSLNKGVINANGKYIARMDADDISLPTRFEEQVRYLNAKSDCGIVGCFVEIIDGERGDRLGIRRYPLDDDKLKEKIFFYSPFAHPAVLIRKTVFDAVGLYSEEYSGCEDLELWFRAGRVFKFANIPKILLKYRYHQDSITFNKIRRMEQLSNSLRLKNIMNPAFKSGPKALLFNIAHLMSLYVIPSKTKIYIFNKFRNYNNK